MKMGDCDLLQPGPFFFKAASVIFTSKKVKDVKSVSHMENNKKRKIIYIFFVYNTH